MRTDLLIAGVAWGQHSLVTRGQLRELGLSDRKIDHRIDAGLLIPAHPRVYRLPGVKPSFEQSVLAACWAGGGVASYRCAAALFGLRGIKPGSLEISVAGRRAPHLEGVVTHQVRRLDATRIGIIPVTMPAQTLLDLASVEPRLVEGATNHALGKKLVTLPRLVRYVREAGGRGRAGTIRLREVIEAQIRGENPTESWLEDRLLEFIRAHGLPDPDRQVWLTIDKGRRIRMDFAFKRVRLDVEADSELWHSTPADRRRDAARDAAARQAGWAVERVTWLQIEEAPEAVAARIRLWLDAGSQAA